MESPEADQLNVEIFKNLKERTHAASEEMAEEYGNWCSTGNVFS
jgi:hypothetical protein